MISEFNNKFTSLAFVFISDIMQKQELCPDSGSPKKKEIKQITSLMPLFTVLKHNSRSSWMLGLILNLLDTLNLGKTLHSLL